MSTPILDGLQFIRAEQDGGILCVTINRPEALNALHPPAQHELARVFDHYGNSDALRVAILTGTGERAFCAGNDLKYRASAGGDVFPDTGFGGITKRFGLLKPIIAAVHGFCLGGGLEMVLATDIAIASEGAQFGLPEPLVGNAATGGGGLQRLARQVGMKNAMWLALRSRRISAADALRIGLVSEVLPASALLPRAREIAQEILACAPLAVEATKQVLTQSLAEPDLAASMEDRYPALTRMTASEDAAEGPEAFAAKRKPVWRGR